MGKSIFEKIDFLEKKFASFSSAEEKYLWIMELGKNLPSYPDSFKIEEKRVAGCQSTLYLLSEKKEGKLFFYADSDALISKGLAALALSIYSGETPETILKTPPDFLSKLGIFAALSPNRSNGLVSLLKKIFSEALFFLKS